MAAITLYPRLMAKADTAYATAIEDAKASLDFMLNSATLSALLAAFTFLVGVYYPLSLSFVRWLLPVLLFSVLSVWFYHQSIGRAGAWGDLVKGSFDLYRNELLKQLGYSQEPKTTEEERRIWQNISKRLIYGDPPRGPGMLIPYHPSQPSPTHAYAEAEVMIEVARGFGPVNRDGALTIILEVHNADTTRRAQNIVVRDTIPEGFGYEWGSAQVESGRLVVRGASPYEFELDSPLDAGGTLRLSYRIIPVAKVNAPSMFSDCDDVVSK
jgi:hypothetical protein